MFEKFFNLTENPFHVTPDPTYLYMSKTHGEALSNLLFGVQQKKGFVLVTGEVGTGKTTLSRSLLDDLAETCETSLILNPVQQESELLATIAEDLGVGIDLNDGGRSVGQIMQKLHRFFLQVASRGKTVVAIIDEAQNLPPRSLEVLRLLSNFETDNEKLVQIILFAQPEFVKKLDSYNLRQLSQRISIRYKLKPLNHADTASYIRFRISMAGGSHFLKFEDRAVDEVYGFSNGIPRLINACCERALLCAYVKKQRTIDRNIVEAAVKELDSMYRKSGFPGRRSIWGLFRARQD